MLKSKHLNSHVFQDLSSEDLSPDQPFAYYYDDAFEAEFIHEIKHQIISNWPKGAKESEDSKGYRGSIQNYWHLAQKDLPIIAEAQELLHQQFKKSLGKDHLKKKDVSAYSLGSYHQNVFHTDINCMNIILYLTEPEPAHQGGGTMLYNLRRDENIPAKEVVDHHLLTNSWARIIPMKFNRLVAINGNFLHGMESFSIMGGIPVKDQRRYSLTFFHEFAS